MGQTKKIYILKKKNLKIKQKIVTNLKFLRTLSDFSRTPGWEPLA